MDLDDLRTKIDAPGRMLILCSPHNPVGRVWDREELEALGRIAVERDLVVIADEIHHDLVYRGHRHHVLAALSPELAQQTITCIAPSKTFNIAGLTTAAVVAANPDLLQKFEDEAERAGFDLGNALGIVAFEAAYRHGEAWLEELLPYLEGNVDLIERFLAERVPGLRFIRPEGTYLALLDCRALGIEPAGLNDFFLKKAGVYFSDGKIFGDEAAGFVRINFGCPRSVLREALERIERAVKDVAVDAGDSPQVTRSPALSASSLRWCWPVSLSGVRRVPRPSLAWPPTVTRLRPGTAKPGVPPSGRPASRFRDRRPSPARTPSSASTSTSTPRRPTPSLGADISEDNIRDLLYRVKPDYVQYDCKGHAGWTGYPTAVGWASPGIVKDSLAVWRKATRDVGVGLFIHYSGVWDSKALAEHPDWARVGPDGKRDANATSVFGPYVDELLIPQLKEVTAKYGLDGVWADGECWATQLDYSPRALAAWKAETGYADAPKDRFRRALARVEDVPPPRLRALPRAIGSTPSTPQTPRSS